MDAAAKAARKAELEVGLPAGWTAVVTATGEAMYCPSANLVPGNKKWEMQRERPSISEGVPVGVRELARRADARAVRS